MEQQPGPRYGAAPGRARGTTPHARPGCRGSGVLAGLASAGSLPLVRQPSVEEPYVGGSGNTLSGTGARQGSPDEEWRVAERSFITATAARISARVPSPCLRTPGPASEPRTGEVDAVAFVQGGGRGYSGALTWLVCSTGVSRSTFDVP